MDSQMAMTAKRDQVWAELRDMQDKIQRVALEGPQSEEDGLLVRKCLMVVVGELYARRAENSDLT